MDALQIIRESFEGGTIRLLTLSQPDRSFARGDADVQKVSWKPVLIRGETRYQKTRQTARQAFHENQSATEAAADAVALLSEQFQQAALFTDEADFAIHRRGTAYRVRKSEPTRREAEPAAHNRSKQYLIPEGRPCAFLEAIGVMTPDGRVRKAMYHKFRQINRYLELVEDVVPHLPSGREIRVVDFGCGKSYLTFALHHLLTVVHGRAVHIVGLDQNAEVVRDCQGVADRLRCSNLRFEAGRIERFDPGGPVDLVVSLHACDTATDDSLARGVAWSCPVLLAVPCCQHELAPQLASPDLSPLLEQGILRERLGSLATDALRASLLEWAGYRTQIVEFIDLEHTPKNLLIRAVRRDGPGNRDAAWAEYVRCRDALGIRHFRLEALLTESPA